VCVCGPTKAIVSTLLRFLAHIQRCIKVGVASLIEWPDRHRHLHMTTHSTHNRQISMDPVGFQPAIPASKRPQTHALDRAATRCPQYNVFILIKKTSFPWVLNYSSSPVLINCELTHREDLRISKRWIWMSINLRHVTSEKNVILACTTLGNKQRERGVQTAIGKND